jgi:iron complex transport system ATP-binding protein
MSDLLLRGEGLTAHLGERRVLDGLDITLSKGEVVGLIGPNGAGKTSALRALLRLLPLEAGRVTLLGQEVTHQPAYKLAGRVSYLPQGQGAHWPLTVERLVALGRLPHRTAWQPLGEEDRAAVARALAAADARHLIGRVVTGLSGGERARVLLARALAVEAPMLLVDEPIVSLDPYHQLSVMDTLRAEAGLGRGVLVVLHDLAFAARYCDRLYLIAEGKLKASGKPEEVLTETLLEEVYRVRVRRGPGGEVSLLERLNGERP